MLIAYSVCVYGQQFGPVPPQPQHFAGATLIQPPRANFRPRFNNARPSETIPSSDHFQTVRSRRPQILRKPNPLLPQQQILEQPKANLIEDVPAQFPNAAPTPLPQFQQQLTTRALTPRPVQEEVHEGLLFA